MASEVILPMMGETMSSGTIVAWLKQEGEPVRRGDVLFTLESDKATLEVEAQADGILRRILVPAGQTVPVLTRVGLIASNLDEDLSPLLSAPAAHAASARRVAAGAPEAVPPSPAAAPAGRLIASPRARRLARQRTIDLRQVAGSGPGGRIVERDLAAWPGAAAAPRLTPVAHKAAEALGVDLSRVQGSGPGGRVTRQDVELAAAPPPQPGAAEVRPLTRTQRLMAERMAASFSQAPHFYLHVEVDARRLLALREQLLPSLQAQAGARLTLTDLLVKLSALALARHPQVMAQWTPEGLRQARQVNIGVATDTPTGLVVPVVRQADRLGLAELARQRTELVERARAGKSLPQDFELGVFTLTNLGMFRVDAFDAILNPPQAAILAVGRIRERPLAEAGRLIAAPTLILSLSVDHRVLDGVAAARFLDDLSSFVETPALALA